MRWVLQPASAFSRFAKIWDASSLACGNLPFLRSAFLEPLLREFGTGREVLILGLEGETAIVAGLMVRNAPGVWETFQPSQLPVGAWLLRPGQELESVLRDLLAHLPGFALVVGITQQDPNSTPRPVSTRRLQTLDYIDTAWVDVDGSFENYWNERGKNLRQNMRKQRSKLESQGITPRLEILTSPADVAEAIRDYGALESTGWKAGGGTAIHPDNAQGRFYVDMLKEFCRQGAGRIYRYRFDDRVAAVDLCVESGDCLVILKTTYEESLRALSPAFLMREEAFKAVFDEGRIKRIEFYGARMEWHTRWTANVRALYHINYYRWPWLSALLQLASVFRRPRADSAATTES